MLKISPFQMDQGLFGKDFRVATLSILYLTVYQMCSHSLLLGPTMNPQEGE